MYLFMKSLTLLIVILLFHTDSEDKAISAESLMDLAECVLKNIIFEHNLSFLSNQGEQP